MRRHWGLLRWWLLAAGVTGCLESTSGPGRFGELTIQAEFAIGEDPPALGVSVDSTIVTVTRATSGEIVIDTAFGPGAETIAHGWIVDLETDQEPLQVDLELRGQGTRLYAGTLDVTVVNGDIATGVINPVPVAYVGPAPVDSVSVTPASSALNAVGATLQFTAQGFDAAGGTISGLAFTWTSSDPAVATIDPVTGLATAAGHGNTTITATANGVSGTATLTVSLTGSVTTVTVLPASATLTTVGATQQFTAEVRDGNGTLLPGVPATWTVSDPLVATVDPVTGLATAAGHGSTTITATANGVSGTATLTVSLTGSVTTVTVLPASATLTTVGATQQFTAEVRDGNGTLLPGVPVTWTVSDPLVATIDPNTGLATAAGQGSTTITATANGVSDTATLTVNLTSSVTTVTVLPPSASLTTVGATQQFTAEVRDGSGTLLPGVPVTWTSADSLVATIDSVTGLATAAGHGNTTITATANGVSGTATITVTLTGSVTTVSVLPASATLTTVGATQQFTAEVRDGNGTLLPGVPVSWSSADPLVATIDPNTGLATAAGHGSTTITATANGVSDTATLTVNLTSSVTTVTVLPPSATLTTVGATQQFTAEVRDGNGTLLPGVPVSWTSADPLVATIDPSTGLAAAMGHGNSTITATANSVSGTATLTVNLSGGATTVTVLPATATLTALGATQQFTAEVRDGSGTLLPGVPVSWTSADSLVATIDSVTGLATAAGHGSTTITAIASGVSGTATLTVNLSGSVTTVTVLPATATLTALGATQQFTAEVRDGSGTLLPGVPVSWTSADPLVATVDPVTGLATAVGHGNTTITATAGSVSGSASLDVNLTASVATVTVIPGSATLTQLAASQQFTAEARDASGTLLPGVPVSWTSSDPLVARIDAVTGLATAAGSGLTQITATAGGVSGTAELRVSL